MRAGEGQVRAMILLMTNPVRSAPIHRARGGVRQMDFLVRSISTSTRNAPRHIILRAVASEQANYEIGPTCFRRNVASGRVRRATRRLPGLES